MISRQKQFWWVQVRATQTPHRMLLRHCVREIALGSVVPARPTFFCKQQQLQMMSVTMLKHLVTQSRCMCHAALLHTPLQFDKTKLSTVVIIVVHPLSSLSVYVCVLHQEDASSSGHHIKYVSHVYSGGADCLLTGAPRTSEVRVSATRAYLPESAVATTHVQHTPFSESEPVLLRLWMTCHLMALAQCTGLLGSLQVSSLHSCICLGPLSSCFALTCAAQLIPAFSMGCVSVINILSVFSAAMLYGWQVRYTCARDVKENVVLSVREFPTCNYVVVVSTPFLCKHPAFTPPVSAATAGI